MLILTALMLALIPIATAGPGATVDTLDDRGSRCASDAWWWSDGNSSSEGGWSSSGYSQSGACASGYDYATVTVDDHRGEAARVTLHADHANHSQSGRSSNHAWGSDWSSSSYGWNNAWGDAWSRGATADTRAGSASAAYGCRMQAADEQGHWWHDSNGYSYESHQSSSTSDSRCGTTATALGDEAFVGQSCAGGSTGAGQTSSWNGTRERQYQYASGSHCTDGVTTSAASAGTLSSCSTETYGGSRPAEGNESSTGWSWNGRTCQNGVQVLGPDGAALFVGLFERESTYCDDESGCSGYTSRAGAAWLDWEHNPFGPGLAWVSVPLP